MPLPSRKPACVVKPHTASPAASPASRHAREIDPGGDVLHADQDQGILVRAVSEVTAQRAMVRCG